MLVLSRRLDESLIIEGSDGPIEVLIVRVGRDAQGRSVVRLGIQAADHVTIDRKEVYERVQQEGRIKQ